jgi:excisionase family DNA binding protein
MGGEAFDNSVNPTAMTTNALPYSPDRRYLDVSSAATYLGTSSTAIYATVARRQIPFRRLGRKLLFDKSKLDTYIKALEGVSVEEAVTRIQNRGITRALEL